MPLNNAHFIESFQLTPIINLVGVFYKINLIENQSLT